MNPKRKELTLPSGAICKIRALSTFDFASGGLNAPDTTTAHKETPGAPDPKVLEYGLKVSRVALLKACGAIFINGHCHPIVDKPHYETAGREITIEEMEQADAELIIKEVLTLSSMGKEAAKAAQNFPEETQPRFVDAPAG